MSPLKDTLIPAVLNTGLDTGKDPKVVSQGLLRLENSVFDYEGQLRKRHGLRRIIASGRYLGVLDDTPILYGSDVQVYNSEDDTFDEAVSSLSLINCGLEPLYSEPNHQFAGIQIVEFGDIWAICGSKFDVVSSTIDYFVKTYNRYTRLEIDSYSTSGEYVRLLSVGNGSSLYFFTLSGSPAVLVWGTISADGTIGTPSTISGSASNTDTNIPFDVCAFGVGNNSIFLGHYTLGGAFEPLAYNGSSWSVGSTISVTTADKVGCFKLSTNIAVALYSDRGTTPRRCYAVGYDNTASVVISSVSVLTWTSPSLAGDLSGVGKSSIGYIYVTLFDSTLTVNQHLIREGSYWDSGGGVGTNGTVNDYKYGGQLYGKPWADYLGNIHLLSFRYDGAGDVEGAYILTNDSHEMETMSMHGFADDSGGGGYVVQIHEKSSNEWMTVLCKKTGDSTNAMYIANFRRHTLVGKKHAMEVNGILSIPSGIPLEFDGKAVVESGFSVSPKIGSLTESAGGYLTLTSSYGYVAIFEWYNAKGQIYRSAQSPVSSITLTGSNRTVTVVVRTISYTMKDDVAIVLCRTLANGAVYHRCQTVWGGPYAAQYVSIVDTAADSSIADNEILYTQGGVLNNYPPPTYDYSTVHQQRMFIAPTDDPVPTVRYSQSFLTDTGIEHSPFLEIEVPTPGGEITALASFMDRLIIFKETRIYACTGTGLSMAGTGSGYSDPVMISEAIGCVNSKTLVQCPLGLMFEGPDGIYLLDKSLMVSPIGEPVRWHYKQIDLARGILIPEDNYVIFLPDGFGEKALVFNYLRQQWSTFTNHHCQDAVEAGGLLYLYYTDVYAQDRSLWRDNDADIIQRIRTGWFSFAKLTGVQYIRGIVLEGQNISDHQIRLKIAYDEPVFVDDQTFNSNTLENMDIDDHYGSGLSSSYSDNAFMIEAGTSIIECSKIMLEITDEDDGVVDLQQGFSLTGIGFIVAIEDGFKRLGSARRF
jgi:hypothetical protein